MKYDVNGSRSTGDLLMAQFRDWLGGLPDDVSNVELVVNSDPLPFEFLVRVVSRERALEVSGRSLGVGVDSSDSLGVDKFNG